MGELAAIAAGGGLGALMRFWVSGGIYALMGREFPYGTLGVNLIGSFVIGLAFVLLTERLALGTEFRAFIIIGFLGAFTTFSTFSLETLFLLQEGLVLKAVGNMVLSVLLCLFAAWAGMVLAKSL